MDKHEAKGVFKDAIGKVKDGLGGLTGQPGTQLDGKIDQATGKLERKFGSTIDDVRDHASDLADTGSRLAGQATDQARDAAHAVRSQAGSYANAASDAGAQAGRYVSETAGRQPFLSLAAVAAAGYLVGFPRALAEQPVRAVPRRLALRQFPSLHPEHGGTGQLPELVGAERRLQPASYCS